MGSAVGVEKSAARKCGCTHAEWLDRRQAGERWCYRCQAWAPLANMQGKVCKPCNRAKGARSRYGLSEDDFQKLTAVGACPICARSGQKMEVDHNHTTGAVRAVLCSRCNGALGQFCDDPTLLRRALAYLEAHDHG